MSRGIVVSLAILAIVASSAFAKTPQQPSAQDVPIVLEVRWLTLTSDFKERVGPKLEKLPAIGTSAVRSAEQTKLLLDMAERDRRAGTSPSKTITLRSGKPSEFAPYGLDRDLQGKDSIQVILGKDHRTVDIRLTWAKWKNGTKRLPVMTASVPIGCSLVVHAKEVSSGRILAGSVWQQLTDKITRQTRATAYSEKQGGYFLISPRITTLKESQPQTAAR